MNKIVLTVLLICIKLALNAQIPNESSLVNLHTINNLSDTSSINNPNQGSVLYVSNNNISYQYNGIKWVEWYKQGEVETNIDSLTVLINNITSTPCCNSAILNHVVCSPPNTYCVGDTFSCGVVVHVTADQTEAWVVAPDEFIEVQWTSTTMCGLSYLGGTNITTLDIVNNCPTGVTAGRVAYEYQPEGCRGNGVQWELPHYNMLFQLEDEINTVEPILELIGAQKPFNGNLYWTVGEANAQSAFVKEYGNPTQISTPKMEDRRVRPFTVIQLP